VQPRTKGPVLPLFAQRVGASLNSKTEVAADELVCIINDHLDRFYSGRERLTDAAGALVALDPIGHLANSRRNPDRSYLNVSLLYSLIYVLCMGAHELLQSKQVPFDIQHSVEGDIEASRLQRIWDATTGKVQKLLPWKSSSAETILILEEDDIFRTNHFNVTDIQIERSTTNRPDEVTSMWLITRLRVGDTTLYDMPMDDRFWETNPASLVKISARVEIID
jgi:hypothetical protein